MSYFESGDLLMRGYLTGATGNFGLDIEADTADIADTINITHGSVTVQYSAYYTNKHVTKGQNALSLTINVPDKTAFLELIFHCSSGGNAYLDSTHVIRRSGHIIQSAGFGLRDIYKVSHGQHIAKIVAGGTGNSAQGYIVCRSIRDTGTDNA